MAQIKEVYLQGDKENKYVFGESQHLSFNFINEANYAYQKGQVVPLAGDSIEIALARLIAGFANIIYKIKTKQY